MSGTDPSVWTVRIHGEADDTFYAVLQLLGPGWVVGVEHAAFTGDAEFVAVAPRSIKVRPYNERTCTYGEPIELDWTGLDALEVY